MDPSLLTVGPEDMVLAGYDGKQIGVQLYEIEYIPIRNFAKESVDCSSMDDFQEAESLLAPCSMLVLAT